MFVSKLAKEISVIDDKLFLNSKYKQKIIYTMYYLTGFRVKKNLFSCFLKIFFLGIKLLAVLFVALKKSY
jgi:hypothetical protein